VVRELFARYAAGGWSHRTLANWMNTDPRVPPRSATGGGAGFWTAGNVRGILANPVYCGLVRYNRRPSGLYDRATKGSVFVVDGRHDALIDRGTFDRVQERTAAAYARPSYNRQHHAQMGSGLFVCRGCGGPMAPCRSTTTNFYYKCGRRRQGSLCAEPSCARCAGCGARPGHHRWSGGWPAMRASMRPPRCSVPSPMSASACAGTHGSWA
jgi:site-specific DNA recombinase